MQKIALFGTLFLTALFGCTSKRPFVYAPEAVVPKDKALLWKITANGAAKPSYLFGTIHIIPKNEFEMTDATVEAIKGCDRIAFEIDMKDMTNIRTQIGLMTKIFMKNGTTLRELLSAEDYALVRREMDDKGMPGSMLERIKPLFLSTMFSGDGEDDDDNPMSGLGIGKSGKVTSVEMELWRKAKKFGLKSTGLETAESQLAIFDAIPYEAQAKMLVESIRSGGGTEGGGLMDLVKMYKEGDVAALHDLTATDKSGGIAGYEDLLLYNRNRNWIGQMREMVRDYPTFFAVGAGHLGGDQGVIALLRREGFRVEPVLEGARP